MFSSVAVRKFALAQAAFQHGVYFLEIGADQRAAAYFEFAAEHLQDLTFHLRETQFAAFPIPVVERHA
jgi:hypothetical protein